MTERITSGQNPKIKRLLALQQKSSARRESGLFVVEGRRELQHCIDAGFEIDSVFFCSELFAETEAAAASGNRATLGNVRGGTASEAQRWGPKDVSRGWLPLRSEQVKVFEVTREVYGKIAMRDSTEGVIAEVRSHTASLADLRLGEHPLIVVLERVEKPGNLGAVLRSADAAGADAVIVCDPLTDLWNPNLIRASIGAIFTVPCVACSTQEAIAFLQAHGIKILTAQLQDSSLYYDTDMRCGVALVMGTESTGLTEQWRRAADAHIRIPMLGALDSLNVSVSAAILLFEAIRQRNG